MAKTLKKYKKDYTINLNYLIEAKPLFYIWRTEELKTEINKLLSKRKQITTNQLSYIYRDNYQYKIFKSY